MNETVVIDCFPSSVAQYVDDRVIVAVDVIRATTMAVTAVASGRRCIVAADPQDAFAIRDRLGDALLAGELGGDMPAGFDMNNSPTELERRGESDRPLVMLSTLGTKLMLEAGRSANGAYVACFRNFTAVARQLVADHLPVALIGAGSRGEFREEDQMGCAWIGKILVDAGYEPINAQTTEIIERWRGVPATACKSGNSAAYLRRSGQLDDFDFVTTHVDDLEIVCSIDGNEVQVQTMTAP